MKVKNYAESILNAAVKHPVIATVATLGVLLASGAVAAVIVFAAPVLAVPALVAAAAAAAGIAALGVAALIGKAISFFMKKGAKPEVSEPVFDPAAQTQGDRMVTAPADEQQAKQTKDLANAAAAAAKKSKKSKKAKKDTHSTVAEALGGEQGDAAEVKAEADAKAKAEADAAKAKAEAEAKAKAEAEAKAKAEAEAMARAPLPPAAIDGSELPPAPEQVPGGSEVTQAELEYVTEHAAELSTKRPF